MWKLCFCCGASCQKRSSHHFRSSHWESSQWYDTPAGPHPADGRGLQPLGQDQASAHQQEVPLWGDWQASRPDHRGDSLQNSENQQKQLEVQMISKLGKCSPWLWRSWHDQHCYDPRPTMSAEWVHKIFRHISDEEFYILGDPKFASPDWMLVSHWVTELVCGNDAS